MSGTVGPRPISVPLLLDIYSNAEVAYSLRKLRKAYTGSSIRVRRLSDNTEQDIGFVGNDLDTTSLLSFVGASNGFITTWYDQSGNANNAVNTTALRQAQIVSLGNLYTDPDTGKISAWWTTDGYNLITPLSTVQEMYHYMVFNRIGAFTNSGLVVSNSTTATMLRWLGTNEIRTYLDTPITHTTDSSTGPNLITTLRDNTNTVKMFKNTIALTTGVASNTGSPLTTWGIANGSYNAGYHSELIHWNLDQEANRTAIETNVNNYWTIY
jgi:hypothetical protein